MRLEFRACSLFGRGRPNRLCPSNTPSTASHPPKREKVQPMCGVRSVAYVTGRSHGSDNFTSTPAEPPKASGKHPDRLFRYPSLMAITALSQERPNAQRECARAEE